VAAVRRARLQVRHIARGVYAVEIPAGSIAGEDFEYAVKVSVAGQSLVFPAGGDSAPQTVVVIDRH